MFGKGKNKDGPLSPPIKGSWEFQFNNELKTAVQRRDKINQELAEKRPKSISAQTGTCGGLSPYSLSPASSPSSTPLSTPSPIDPSQFNYSPPNTAGLFRNDSGKRKSKNKSQANRDSMESPRSSTINAQDVLTKENSANGNFKPQTGLADRQSLALDSRGASVLSMVSRFDILYENEDNLIGRKRSTTMPAPADINSSKY